MSDAVNHPKHYEQVVPGLECIDLSELMNFNLGNAFKYVWRCRDKHTETQDVQNALWYLERQLSSRRRIIWRAPVIEDGDVLDNLRKAVAHFDSVDRALDGRALWFIGCAAIHFSGWTHDMAKDYVRKAHEIVALRLDFLTNPR